VVTRPADLPYVDEHQTVVAASPVDVWTALLEAVDKAFTRPGAGGYARLVGCADRTASGPRPLAEGSSVPGFRVVEAVPPETLVLAGRHRFSSYRLTFRIEPLDEGRSRLSAETRAAFPGPAGGIYRTLVIGTGGHVVVMRRLLSGIGRAAERAARASS
jgi:hypothetical protein